MPSSSTTGRVYKELTLQQLRSFCETARLGSFTAAAASLGLAHPTVWKQVHALEREFGAKLVEPYGRGCRLTEAGRVLAELAGPAVGSIAGLKRCFQEALAQVETRLTVAASPRILVEDLPECVVAFEGRWPQVRLTLKELRNEEIAADVEAGHADLGFTVDRGLHANSPWLVFEPCYTLEIILITPEDHPLARCRRVRLRDLCAYPLVNAPASFPEPEIRALLEDLGLFQTQPRRVEAFYAAAIRRYVEIGFGIGLIGRVPSHRPHPGLHERSMSRYFQREPVYVVRRKAALQPEAARLFAETVRTLLNRPPARARRH
jgi:DNA-binding transcriptional LysR family regulator